MSDAPNLRFLFASHLNLDDSVRGFTELPEKFRDRFVNARRVAATHLVDAAIEQDVDFVLVAGSVSRPNENGLAGSRCFVQACQRLQQYDIPLVWVSDALASASDDWPRFISLPDNVHRVQLGRHASAEVAFEGASLRIESESSKSNPSLTGNGRVHGQTRIKLHGLHEADDRETGQSSRISKSQDASSICLHVSGSPQAECLNAEGGYCELIEQTSLSDCDSRTLPTAAVVFHRLDILTGESAKQVLAEIAKLAKTVHAETVCCVDIDTTEIASPSSRNESTHELRRLVADRFPNVWVNSIRASDKSSRRDRNGLLDEVLEQFTDDRVQAACETLFEASSSLCDVPLSLAMNWADVRREAVELALNAIAAKTPSATTHVSPSTVAIPNANTHSQQHRRAA